ncbi:DNA-3-methyladenine glycosylase 2 family protein [Sulfitobacter sp. M57]|uniref:DNA-3-methyladenine glycosylase family protein n=1 Tax=unclassified Sulfitobacter TaxID=196795 RepID=UPI0023E2DFDC|nr:MULTISPECIES: DNA-3-methyladenine glycosylase 2 family protein [unclassified Sulfitobacter]MDF3413937.1 DNA-3-methyladenine glycosylase 2 family protein [Sulfitobacter sp. KE5]MDF3420782.1 DNA-3-methyladenine glycosylase 2 family protein [Sulfitobacter sp. KE43]MDF3432483.1 DNA-3-methyladenine glycosylase 2 family protein [Sulfitobacter sp. KE42]MDF3458122.1 DNA-3-methyladenine glycosylase 2 family protein [Sulfitobacter sp. S74]MDF3462023.1 DNA-3-methyladenine glycosylase 2 family protein 
MGWIIRTDLDVAEGAAWLAQSDVHFAQALALTGPLPLRLKPDGFGGLLEIIISQQVSVASADAIRARLLAAGLNTKAAVLKAGDAGLCDAGLSRPKARYALILAASDLDYTGLHRLDDAQVLATLTAITGIGPWSAQIYAMFCMGRADIFPAGDLALQVAAQGLFDLPARPTAQEMAEMAEAWTPWRSVAARALFAYYRILKNREGLG